MRNVVEEVLEDVVVTEVIAGRDCVWVCVGS